MEGQQKPEEKKVSKPEDKNELIQLDFEEEEGEPEEQEEQQGLDQAELPQMADDDEEELSQSHSKKKRVKVEQQDQAKLLNGKELIDLCKYHKRELKLQQYDVPSVPNIIVYDISIQAKAQEDKIFAEKPQILMNVRRGNSVLEILNQKKQSEEFVIIRRGLKKFFDVYLEYLDYANKSSKVLNSHLNNNNMHQRLKEIVLGRATKVLLRNQDVDKSQQSTIHIYKLEKANGENAQVSYLKQFNLWVIASKNVSLLVNNRESLKTYANIQRYSFAVLIAEQWFQMVEKLSPEQLSELQQAMQGHTFVGEYCGNQNYQHLIRYNQINIWFYAIVENQSADTCLPPEKAMQIFKKFSLNTVKFDHFKTQDFEEFSSILHKIYMQVGHSSVEEQGEGSVLYFVSQTPDQNFQTLSLCKLKTIEYRLYRKLREKIKNFLAKKGNQNYTKILNDYIQQSRELCEFVDPHKPLEYYIEVAKEAFNNLNAKDQTGREVSNRYIDYLDKIKQIVSKKQLSATQGSQKSSQQQHPGQEEEAKSGQMVDESVAFQIPASRRVIIISPPYYLSQKVLYSIKAEFNLAHIENSWSETQEILTPISIVNLHIPPRIKDKKANIQNTFFLVVGFAEALRERVKKVIDDQRETFQDQDKNNNQIKPYMQVKDLFEGIGNKYKQTQYLINDVIQILPDNQEIVEEDIYKVNPVSKQVDEESGCTYMKNKITQALQKLHQNQKQELIKHKSGSKKKLVVFLPLTIPATGKSFLIEQVKGLLEKDENYSLRIISSDEIRRNLMENVRKTENIQDEDKLFQRTGKKAGDMFFSQLKTMVEQTEALKSEYNIIFIDKNHPVNNIERTVETIQSGVTGQIQLKIVAIVPECCSKFSFPDKQTLQQYDFSLFYLLTCLSRAWSRTDHLTLKGDPYKVADVIFMFFKLFRHFKFSPHTMKNKSIDHMIYVKYHVEDAKSEQAIPEVLRKLVCQLLQQQQADQSTMDNFIQEFQLADLNFQYPDIEEQVKLFMASVKECFYLFNEKK